LGLAYKQDTNSTKNSPALALLSHLQDRVVFVYDPLVQLENLGLNVIGADSALAAVQYADVVCVMTPWNEFKSLAISDIAYRMRGRLLIDPFCVFDRSAVLAAGLDYVTLGVTNKC
jgi:UDPglucose 6-dehydrogenase